MHSKVCTLYIIDKYLILVMWPLWSCVCIEQGCFAHRASLYVYVYCIPHVNSRFIQASYKDASIPTKMFTLYQANNSMWCQK